MKNKQQGFIHIFLILVIAVIGIGAVGYLAYKNGQIKIPYPNPPNSPTPTSLQSDISNWKTYTNSNYNISFQYPGDWETLNGALYNTLPRLVTFETKKLTNIELEIPHVIFFVAYHDNIQDINTWLSENYMGAKIVSKKNISGHEFLLVNGGTQFQSREHILNIGQNKYLRFVFEPVEISQVDTIDNEFDQILSTFKFTDVLSQPKVIYPLPNSQISSPLRIEGNVPSGWMFEGVFPIKLLDENRNLIAQGRGQESTPGSWQSGNPTNFEGKIIFTTTAKSGFLVLENDNPSGLPENSKSYEIPINF